MVETFFSRDVTDMRVLAHFELKRFEPIKSLCAKLFYIFSNIYFGTNVLKKSDKKIVKLRQNDLIFTKIFEIYQAAKCFNTLKLYTQLKGLLSKNRFDFFFLIF